VYEPILASGGVASDADPVHLDVAAALHWHWLIRVDAAADNYGDGRGEWRHPLRVWYPIVVALITVVIGALSVRPGIAVSSRTDTLCPF